MRVYPGNKIEQAAKRCGIPVAPSNEGTCDFCGRTLEEDRLHYCDCGNTVCTDHLHTCVACGEGQCPECIVSCGECGKPGCANCCICCEACGAWMCQDHYEGHSSVCSGKGLPPLV